MFNQRGFSLIEVSVASGIALVSILAVSSLINESLKMQNRLEAKQDLISFVDQIRLDISGSGACTTSLQGVQLDVPGSQTEAGSSVPQLVLPTGTAGSSVDLRVGQGVPNYDSIRLEKLSLLNATQVGVGSSGLPIYRARLVGRFSPVRTAIGGGFQQRQIASVDLSVDSFQRVTSCTADGSGAGALGDRSCAWGDIIPRRTGTAPEGTLYQEAQPYIAITNFNICVAGKWVTFWASNSRNVVTDN